MNLGEEQILYAAENDPEGHQSPKPHPRREHEHQRPNEKTPGKHERDGRKYRRNRYACFQQEHCKERARAVQRKRVQPIVQVQEIYGAVLEVSHAPI